jgi:hypothetical protein
MIKFIIPYPKTPEGMKDWAEKYGLNAIYSGKHWSKRKKDSEYWHQLVFSELRRQGIEPILHKAPVEIRFFWNDGLDIDNHAYMGKMIVDSLKGYLIKNDTRKYLSGVLHRFHDKDRKSVV